MWAIGQVLYERLTWRRVFLILESPFCWQVKKQKPKGLRVGPRPCRCCAAVLCRACPPSWALFPACRFGMALFAFEPFSPLAKMSTVKIELDFLCKTPYFIMKDMIFIDINFSSKHEYLCCDLSCTEWTEALWCATGETKQLCCFNWENLYPEGPEKSSDCHSHICGR